MEDAGVVVVERLLVRHHTLEEARMEREVGDRGQQPAVAQLALLHVEPGGVWWVEVGEGGGRRCWMKVGKLVEIERG